MVKEPDPSAKATENWRYYGRGSELRPTPTPANQEVPIDTATPSNHRRHTWNGLMLLWFCTSPSPSIFAPEIRNRAVQNFLQRSCGSRGFFVRTKMYFSAKSQRFLITVARL